MLKTGLYTYENCNGWIDVVEGKDGKLYCQRFIMNASGTDRINIGKEWVLTELPQNWFKFL